MSLFSVAYTVSVAIKPRYVRKVINLKLLFSVVDLRANGVRSAPPGSHCDLEGPLSSSLHVSGMTLPSREGTLIGKCNNIC